MAKPVTRTSVVRRPPTNAKLQGIVDVLREIAKKSSWSDSDIREHGDATEAIRKLYKNGLPSGLDPDLVRAAISASMPLEYDILRLTKKAGSEYDAAIIAGVKDHLDKYSIDYVLWPALVAALAEHGGVTIARANELLSHAGREVNIDPSTNMPTDHGPAVLDRVHKAMAPWFSSSVVASTLSIARRGMPPTRWTGPAEGATAPQGDDEWALFIGCAFYPSEETTTLFQERVQLIPLLAEPERSVVNEVLKYTGRAG
jgi:hypothetical protein